MLKSRINTIKIKYYILLWEQDAGGSNPFTPTTPAVSNSRAAGFSIFDFCARVLSGYLFINTSQACGEQFTRRRFFLFLAFVPAFQGGYLFINTSQACGEQFTRRRFFLFLAFVPAFQGGYLFSTHPSG